MADTHYFRAHPAPDSWQERIKALDPDLWIALNTVHPDGPRWCVLRWVGEGVLGQWSAPILGMGEFVMALQRGWSFVRDLEFPDGSPATSLQDMHVLDLFRDDFWRKYGREIARARPKVEALQGVVEANAKARDKAAFDEAYQEANSDGAVLGRTSVVMPAEKDAA